MVEQELSGLSKELLEILKNKGKLSIEELLEWIKSKNASNLVLSATITELETNGLIKTEGIWEKSEPLFPLPKKIEIITKKQEVKVEKKQERKEEDDLEKKVKEYIAKYYSVGELRLRLDFANKTKEIDPILRSLEEKGLIYWDRELGVITASQELANEYKKSKSLLDVF